MAYEIEKTGENVLTLRHNDVALGWSQEYLLISDVHFDSPHCDRKLLTKHLNEAVERKAGILCFGDWFDAMGGKGDKRAHKEGVRTENQRDNYFDSLVDDSAAYLDPYRDFLVLMTQGNHETAITKHQETDLLARLCRHLDIACGGYSGFVRLMTQGAKGNRATHRLHWHHGWGGAGAVTKNMTANNRKAASIEADIFVGGHTHTTGYDENVIVKLSDSGRIYLDTQYHITIPGYKQEYTPAGGFHIERGRNARPNGGWWMRLMYEEGRRGKVGVEFSRAR